MAFLRLIVILLPKL